MSRPENAEVYTADLAGNPMILFHSGWTPYSNFYHSPFVVDGARYETVEQFYQATKAAYFGDFEQSAAIRSTKAPSKCKHLSKNIKNFDQEAWHEVAEKVMLRGVKEKFLQHEELRRKLLDTKRALLVEATKYDTYWASGLAIEDEGHKDAKLWRGGNKLGEILMLVREIVREL